MSFQPKPIPPEQLTEALRDGLRDVPRAGLGRAIEPYRDEEPPLRASPPPDVPKRFTSFRLPVDLDEELRAMIFETRRSKQDLLIEFIREGVRKWRQARR